MFCGKILPLATIIIERNFDFLDLFFFLIFKQTRLRSLAKWSVHSLWLAFSSGWRAHRSMFVVSQKWQKGWGKRKRGREEKEGGTERRFLLLSLHTFSLLLPSALANTCATRAVTTLLCPSWLFSLWYWALSSSAVGGSGVTAWLWRRYLSLIWAYVPVPACQLSSLASACCLWKCDTSPQPRWTKCMDREQDPDALWQSDKIYQST